LGGQLKLEDLTSELLLRYLENDIPILTGLSATYLYRHPREIGAINRPDDVAGRPVGHFVIVSGYDRELREAGVADPFLPNPRGETHYYNVKLETLICSILLGVLTYDANLLVLFPPAANRSAAASPECPR
jgi:hypothetical protein